eukprot:g11847.t1
MPFVTNDKPEGPLSSMVHWNAGPQTLWERQNKKMLLTSSKGFGRTAFGIHHAVSQLAPGCGLLARNSVNNRHFSSSEAPLFKKLLIANRGEIACRIMRTCQKLGIKTVAVYSDADALGMHVRTADEAVRVGPAPSAQSYINMDAIMKAIEKTGAEAVHPGYGFMSENYKFVELLEKNGITFVGPNSKAMVSMGDKINSKKIARDAGVSVVPGFIGEIETPEQGVAEARKIGYPVMIKASAGGGGKGIRIARNDEEAVRALKLCQSEAVSSFGDGRLLIEKAVVAPKHIEFQMLGDKHGNVVYLNERECSVQRRNQKIVEEAPSPSVSPELRKTMGEQAVMMAKAVGYSSAGTVEFLVDDKNNFYFLEMNTRLQVEHPVTEQITGVDLVEQMIRVAAGQKLPFTQAQVPLNGWSFEFRVYAEDPYRDFLPSIGKIKTYEEPEGAGIRIDAGVAEGDDISTHYDPMIAKLITTGNTREEALSTMREALDSYYIRGLTTNVPLLRQIAEHPNYIDGKFTTAFMAKYFPTGLEKRTIEQPEVQMLLSSALLVQAKRIALHLSTGHVEEHKKHVMLMEKLNNLVVTLGDIGKHKVQVHDVFFMDGGHVALEWSAEEHGMKRISCETEYSVGQHVMHVSLDEGGAEGEEELPSHIVQVADFDGGHARGGFILHYRGDDHKVDVLTAREHELSAHLPEPETVDLSKVISSPMPGAIIGISVKKGDTVKPGQEVCVIEAMKMQNVLTAKSPGVIKAINVKVGESVATDAVLMEFE